MGYVANTIEITDQEHQELKDERRNQLLEPQELGEVIGNQSTEWLDGLMIEYDVRNPTELGKLVMAAIEENINSYGVE